MIVTRHFQQSSHAVCCELKQSPIEEKIACLIGVDELVLDVSMDVCGERQSGVRLATHCIVFRD